MPDSNTRYTPMGDEESQLRQQIRDLLNLSWDARNEAILAELRRLKALDVKPVS